MTKLSDTQSILLSTASQRESGSLYPLPTSITTTAGPLAKSIGALATRGLIEERETNDASSVARSDGDLRYGLFITAAGKVAIGVEDAGGIDQPTERTPSCGSAEAPRQTKAALVLSLLQRDGGASLDELVAATGWLPHTTRAALTGLRKKGHEIAKTKVDGVTLYSVSGAA